MVYFAAQSHLVNNPPMSSPGSLRYYIAAPWGALAPHAGPGAFARVWNDSPTLAALGEASVPSAMGAFGEEPQVLLSGTEVDVRQLEPFVRECLVRVANRAIAPEALRVTPINQLDGSLLLRVTVE